MRLVRALLAGWILTLAVIATCLFSVSFQGFSQSADHYRIERIQEDLRHLDGERRFATQEEISRQITDRIAKVEENQRWAVLAFATLIVQALWGSVTGYKQQNKLERILKHVEPETE